MIAARNEIAKSALPMNMVPMCNVSHRLLNTGFTGPSIHGIVVEIIIRKAANGATKEPRTMSLNLTCNTR